MKDIRLALMAGIDIPIPELQLTLYQPRIQDIAFMGENDFFTALHYLCLDKTQLVEDESLLHDLTNFQVLLKVIEQSESKEKKNAIITLLSMLFPSCKPLITPRSIVLQNIETGSSTLIDSDNFEVLQDTLKEILCVSSIFQGDNIVYNPGNAAAKRIADKLMRGRRKAAELKGKSNESAISRYLSILAVGLFSMSLEDCLGLTLYQLFDLVERYTLYLDWDVDLRIRLAGGTPKSEAENWMKNIH